MEINSISLFSSKEKRCCSYSNLLVEIKFVTLYNKELSKGIPAADPPMERNNHSALDVKPVNAAAAGLNGLT